MILVEGRDTGPSKPNPSLALEMRLADLEEAVGDRARPSSTAGC